jgi:hypothetical protein
MDRGKKRRKNGLSHYNFCLRIFDLVKRWAGKCIINICVCTYIIKYLKNK